MTGQELYERLLELELVGTPEFEALSPAKRALYDLVANELCQGGTDPKLRAGLQRQLDIGVRVRERRERLGVTQTQLAKVTGVSATSISNIENGYSRLGPKRAATLAVALGCSGEDLLNVTDG